MQYSQLVVIHTDDLCFCLRQQTFNILGGQLYFESILNSLIQTFFVTSDIPIPQATWWLSNVTLYGPPE